MTLEEMKNINPVTVNPDTLVDIATVEVDRSLSRAEQMKQFLKQIKNPYLYKCNGIIVKIAYASTNSILLLYGGDKNRLYMVGDSAGAYLIVYALAMQKSPFLAEAAHITPSTLPVRALGLISGMFYTRRFDKIGLFMPKSLYGPSYKNSSFAPYTNPEHPEIAGNLPPCYLVTSHNDFLRKYTLDFAKTLRRHGIPYKLDDYPPDKRLTHAFSVFNPEFPESQEVIQHLAQYLKSI